MNRLTTLLALGVCVACQGSSPPEPTPARAPEPGRRLPAEFAVFRQHELVIEEIGVPVPAPLTVGSLASPATMTSDDPEVVRVAEDGSLVAQRPGSTVIRGAGSRSQLKVRVEEPRSSAGNAFARTRSHR